MKSIAGAPSGLTIRPALPADLAQVVDVHITSFPGFFLTFLGPRFLKLFYECMQADLGSVILVAACGARIDGFVAGVLEQSGFYTRLLRRRKWAFARAALGALLRRPAIAPRLLRALRRPEEAGRASAEACLMSIAVRPEGQDQGVGSRLVRAFCRELAERGAPAVCHMNPYPLGRQFTCRNTCCTGGSVCESTGMQSNELFLAYTS